MYNLYVSFPKCVHLNPMHTIKGFDFCLLFAHIRFGTGKEENEHTKRVGNTITLPVVKIQLLHFHLCTQVALPPRIHIMSLCQTARILIIAFIVIQYIFICTYGYIFLICLVSSLCKDCARNFSFKEVWLADIFLSAMHWIVSLQNSYSEALPLMWSYLEMGPLGDN